MSTCGSGARTEDYNLGLHIGAVFIILAVSAGACAIPILALRLPRLHRLVPEKAHFVFRHFGTGVLLATAFVHLLPTAFISLIDPCLPSFFNDSFPALAGVIALSAVFMITLAEMIFSPGRSLCAGPISIPTATDHSPDAVKTEMPSDDTPAASPAMLAQPLQLVNDAKLAHGQRNKLKMQCVLLECGILFHSIFIGLALAVSVGRAQIVLLIAIAFHQTFEGLALGSRIAAVGWNQNAVQPWLMALAYGCTTPLGQAIGIATRDLYDPDSATGLIVVGTFNAFSAGLLTYTSLVDLLSEDFLSDHSWRSLRNERRVIAMSLVFFGAFCMSLIGAWA